MSVTNWVIVVGVVCFIIGGIGKVISFLCLLYLFFRFNNSYRDAKKRKAGVDIDNNKSTK